MITALSGTSRLRNTAINRMNDSMTAAAMNQAGDPRPSRCPRGGLGPKWAPRWALPLNALVRRVRTSSAARRGRPSCRAAETSTAVNERTVRYRCSHATMVFSAAWFPPAFRRVARRGSPRRSAGARCSARCRNAPACRDCRDRRHRQGHHARGRRRRPCRERASRVRPRTISAYTMCGLGAHQSRSRASVSWMTSERRRPSWSAAMKWVAMNNDMTSRHRTSTSSASSQISRNSDRK
jgi:hypothetical protein